MLIIEIFLWFIMLLRIKIRRLDLLIEISFLCNVQTNYLCLPASLLGSQIKLSTKESIFCSEKERELIK